jgi:transposase
MLKMALTLDERVEVVLLSGRQGWTQRQVADEFNARHPERNRITHGAVGKLVNKFKETSSVDDKPRVGRPSVGEDIRTGVIAEFHAQSHWLQTVRTPCILIYIFCTRSTPEIFLYVLQCAANQNGLRTTALD